MKSLTTCDIKAEPSSVRMSPCRYACFPKICLSAFTSDEEVSFFSGTENS